MTATDSVAVRTGNVSAGTSVFSMVVLEKPLSKVYPELDLVTTPEGREVAMVHCNNCTSDLNAWVSVFDEFCGLAGVSMEKEKLYSLLYKNAMNGDSDCGDVLSYNFVSGEPVAGLWTRRALLWLCAPHRQNLRLRIFSVRLFIPRSEL